MVRHASRRGTSHGNNGAMARKAGSVHGGPRGGGGGGGGIFSGVRRISGTTTTTAAMGRATAASTSASSSSSSSSSSNEANDGKSKGRDAAYGSTPSWSSAAATADAGTVQERFTTKGSVDAGGSASGGGGPSVGVLSTGAVLARVVPPCRFISFLAAQKNQTKHIYLWCVVMNSPTRVLVRSVLRLSKKLDVSSIHHLSYKRAL